jgi:hypothetical protein
MNKKLKIKFVDFWTDMNKSENNYFYELLSQKYELEFSDHPDVLFYSCYSNNYLKYKSKRIFYSSENIRPDFTACDYAITFTYLANPRHLRFPLFGMYCNPQDLIQKNDREYYENEWKKKSKFCCLVVSNPNANERIDFFYKLSKYKAVDSGGKWNNNIGFDIGPTHQNKLDFIKDYKFVISFENSSYNGYVTEKIIEPLMVNSIPIYWGNPMVYKDINEKRIINSHSFNDFEAVIKKIIELDKNDALAIDVLCQPIFNDNIIPSQINPENVLEFLIECIEEKKIPVSKTIIGYTHYYNKKIKTLILRSTNFIKARL